MSYLCLSVYSPASELTKSLYCSKQYTMGICLNPTETVWEGMDWIHLAQIVISGGHL
jgi:hypothetical protein